MKTMKFLAKMDLLLKYGYSLEIDLQTVKDVNSKFAEEKLRNSYEEHDDITFKGDFKESKEAVEMFYIQKLDLRN